MNNYRQMAGVINYLNAHYTEQPSLEKLASVAGLSKHHFQRKFVAWAGVSPKSFLQHLTLKNARGLLRQGSSVMGVAHHSGLSGASRLHDLCVTLEAATPGEIKRGGEGLGISYGFGFSPFGECLVATSARGIVHLAFVDDDKKRQAINNLRNHWPKANLFPDELAAKNVIQDVFDNDNNNQRSSIRAFVKGTKFQLRVWRALLQVPTGKLVTYGQLAESINQPGASRAVGSALGKNSLAYLIPCHRVIRGTGIIGNYRWGQGRKGLMITHESMHEE
jgi:AraC family transcriptional regulator of adaptative response/methylated-DNA-[protein]-cysteine methyltransferase